MSTVASAYNQWSQTYDAVENKTRDLDANAMKEVVGDLKAEAILELGCGTGKNTVWLAQQATKLVAVDFSEGMLTKAREKAGVEKVEFLQADITKPWNFGENTFDIVTCNLILEHIESLAPVFAEANKTLKTGGYFFISELHPFKQYAGSKARFEKGGETVVLDCFIHHISDYLNDSKDAGFELVRFDEWFDAEGNQLPRLLSLLLRKK